MFLFLLPFFLVYGAMHWYGYRKLRAAVQLGPQVRACVVLLCCLLAIAPILVRVLEHSGATVPAMALSWLGYLWMGFLFLFVVVAGLVDLACWGLRLVSFLAGRRRAVAWPFPVLPFCVAGPVALLLGLYGWQEALDIRLTRVAIPSVKIPTTAPPLRIVQLSDLHLGLVVGPARLARILAVVREARPDLVVITGDLVDAQADGLAAMAGMFQGLAPRYGAYLVAGNHEYYVGIGHALAFAQEAGLRVLHGDAVEVGRYWAVAGVDDPVATARGIAAPGQEERLAAGLDCRRFNILLKHRPEVAPASPFDLQLSGHVHGGQIVPFNLLTRLAYPMATGLRRLAGGKFLYVSRGSGTWGPPLRLLSPPEVTLIEVVPAGRAAKESGQPG